MELKKNLWRYELGESLVFLTLTFKVYQMLFMIDGVMEKNLKKEIYKNYYKLVISLLN